MILAQFIEPHFDIGQLFIAGSLWAAIWLLKRWIDSVDKRLTKHEDVLFNFAQDLSKVMGAVSAWNGRERRHN